MAAPFIPTFLLDLVIGAAEGNGEMTLSELRTSQLAALPYDCPNCADNSGLIVVTVLDGTDHQVADPLCGGMGRTLLDYELVTDSEHWIPTPPAPAPLPPLEP